MTAMMNRVRSILDQRNMSQSSFAREIEVSPQALSAWFSGRNTPSIDAVVKMCEALSVSPSWLLTGREDSPQHQSIVTDDFVCIPLFSAQASCGNGNFVETATLVRLIEVNKNWIHRYCGTANLRALNIICISGDSMSPTLSDGDFIIIDTSVKHAYTDAMFAYMLDDDLFVKRIQRTGRNLTIRSDNPLYPPVVLTPDDMEHGFKVIGRVVTTCVITAI